MAGRVTARARRQRCAVAAAVIALAMSGAAGHLFALDDPTRPPPGVGHGAGKRVAPDEGLVLQSVIISEASRSAIINGEHVMLGGRIGAARLVKVSEAEVVLLVGGNQRRLALYPGVQKSAGQGTHADE